MSEVPTLIEFCGVYLGQATHFDEIRTESLAEHFRQYFHLGPFPALDDLVALCKRLGIELAQLPQIPGAPEGLNIWLKGRAPVVHIRSGLSTRRTETTICHELREIIENAFTRVNHSYTGILTNNNELMNPKSDRFAGCLLMQAEATRKRLQELGYDYAAFASETRRSLASVLLRAQQLYLAGQPGPAPIAGVWLFEAPWSAVESGCVSAPDIKLAHQVHLSGFSMQKTGRHFASRLAWTVFPKARATVVSVPITRLALDFGCPVTTVVRGFDLFGEHDFLVAAEPFFVKNMPWRVLLTGIQAANAKLVAPWLARLGATIVDDTFQVL